MENGALQILRRACPIPIIPSAMILYMMKNKMYKSLKYLETPKGILVILMTFMILFL